jgi:long-chain fatty acid transport protein
MRRIAVMSAAILLAATILAPSARAQGFSVYEHDACVMARGGAGVAAPCSGGSAVFFNPAGILGAGRPWNASAGVTLIAPRGSFTDHATQVQSDLNKATYPVPYGYLTHRFGSRVAVGIGVFAPYGLTTDWPSSFPGRFLAYKTTLSAFYIQPTLAFAITPRIQLGIGVDYVRAAAKVQRHVDASTLPAPAPLPAGSTLALLGVPVGTDLADALFDVKGDGWGGQVGLLISATDRLSIGARYMSQVKTTLTGTASFTKLSTGITLAAGNPFPGVPGGTPLDAVLASAFTTALYNQSASTTITMPSQIVAGLAYKVTRQLSVMADWQYTDWSVFKTLDLKLVQAGQTVSEYEHFKATNAFRGGFEWQAGSRLAIRGGLLTHKGASPDETVTPVLPEGQRFEGTVGAGIDLTQGLRLNLAYQYIQQQDRRGRVYDPAIGDPTPAMNTGIFKFTANLFGASLALAF